MRASLHGADKLEFGTAVDFITTLMQPLGGTAPLMLTLTRVTAVEEGPIAPPATGPIFKAIRRVKKRHSRHLASLMFEL